MKLLLKKFCCVPPFHYFSFMETFAFFFFFFLVFSFLAHNILISGSHILHKIFFFFKLRNMFVGY